MPQSLLQSFQTTSLAGPQGATLLGLQAANASASTPATAPNEEVGGADGRAVFLQQLFRLLGPQASAPLAAQDLSMNVLQDQGGGEEEPAPSSGDGKNASAALGVLPPSSGVAALLDQSAVPLAPGPAEEPVSPPTGSAVLVRETAVPATTTAPRPGRTSSATEAAPGKLTTSIPIAALPVPIEDFASGSIDGGSPAMLTEGARGRKTAPDDDLLLAAATRPVSPAARLAAPLAAPPSPAAPPADRGRSGALGPSDASDLPGASPEAVAAARGSADTVSPAFDLQVTIPDGKRETARSAPAVAAEVRSETTAGTAPIPGQEFASAPGPGASISPPQPLEVAQDSIERAGASHLVSPAGETSAAISAGATIGSVDTAASGDTAPQPALPLVSGAGVAAGTPSTDGPSDVPGDRDGRPPSGGRADAKPRAAAISARGPTVEIANAGPSRPHAPGGGAMPSAPFPHHDAAPAGQLGTNTHATNTPAAATGATDAPPTASTGMPDPIPAGRTGDGFSGLAPVASESSPGSPPIHAAGTTGDRPAASTDTAQRPFHAAEPAARQVEIQLARHAAAGRSHFTLRLDPPELGRVQVSLQFSGDGRVEAAVRADHPHALDLLQRDARMLERALSQAGLRTEGGVQFSLNQHSSQQQPGHGHPGTSDLANQNGAGDGSGGQDPRNHEIGAGTSPHAGEDGELLEAGENMRMDDLSESSDDADMGRLIRLRERLDIEV